MQFLTIRKILIALCCLAMMGTISHLTSGGLFVSDASAQQQGNVPGGVSGNSGDAEYWRAIRQGVKGTVSIPDKKAGVLVQASGDQFRDFRNDNTKPFGAFLLGGVIVLLIIFYAVRGKIKIDAGPSGRTVIRFNDLERFSHWLMASSFVFLAFTGLNTMYGKSVLMPIIGKSAFSGLTYYSKISHNFVGFAFMAGLVLSIILWIKHNIPNKLDLVWVLKGGGLFSKGVHIPAKKFNAGQKVLFWAVSLGGISISFTGICLLMPFEFAPFEPTFAILNIFGFGLPTDLSPMQETQLSLLWHGVMTVVLTALIIAHIYIGSIGMEGAFDAISTGEVDENWAREHHGLWLDEVSSNENSKPAE